MTGQLTDPVQRALAVNQVFHALGNERLEADGAIFIRNRETPAIWDANHMTAVTASTDDQIDQLLKRAEREYAGFPHRRFDLDFTTPPQFEARLALEGYQRSDALVMLLEGGLTGSAKPHDIRLVTDEADWQAHVALHDLDWREYSARITGSFDEETARQMMLSRRSKSPPARLWLAYMDGEPRAYCSSWPGPAGTGLVEDVFTHPDFRRRGLATALIHHCVGEVRREGAGPVVIVADTTDTPKQMYAAMGFRPVAVVSTYRKDVKPG
jgi:GNAT superfamily N-acetyltransferase